MCVLTAPKVYGAVALLMNNILVIPPNVPGFNIIIVLIIYAKGPQVFKNNLLAADFWVSAIMSAILALSEAILIYEFLVAIFTCPHFEMRCHLDRVTKHFVSHFEILNKVQRFVIR
jgi:hypothetical protein